MAVLMNALVKGDTSESTLQTFMVFLAIAQALSYIPVGPWSFWKLVVLLLQVTGFFVALCLIWVVVKWIAKKISASRRR